MNGFVSPKRLDVRFYCPRRKSKFGSKLRKAKRTFSFSFQSPPPASFRGPISHQLAGSLHPFSLSPLPAGASRHLGVELAGGAIGYGRFPTPAHGGALSGVLGGQHVGFGACSKCMFHVFKMFHKNVTSVSYGCCKVDLDIAMSHMFYRHIVFDPDVAFLLRFGFYMLHET